ncbi:hypothetical protein GCM10025880_31310 [Methylorubrum aminovorans]|uniref:alpha/beta fold hydrolase n=1 Tax=Methylorubrum aminovorans TaxID=269069 RepID=UPI0023E9219A|nr:alpha/beta hydrolase [Methylorubrum aminovorans]GMA76714.1 hypothetical protein GCM10025880_31310 [Methylorubrum aminovorans]
MQSFDSDGVQIAYIDVPAKDGAPGGGDPILLIHGFASNHAVNWVNTLWVRYLTEAGYRVVAHDNRGHGQSEKLYEPTAYTSDQMAGDAVRLLRHLGIERADVMGYSMGARIGAHMALDYPGEVRSLLLGGMGFHLVDGHGLPQGIAEALEAPPARRRRTRPRRPSARSRSRPRATCGRLPPASAARARPFRGPNSRRSTPRPWSRSAPSTPWQAPGRNWRS